jgi:hypothetical protein
MKKRSGKWMGRVSAGMKKRGTKGSYGHHSVAEDKANIRKGGKIAKKAEFDLAQKATRGKYHGKKKKKTVRKKTMRTSLRRVRKGSRR